MTKTSVFRRHSRMIYLFVVSAVMVSCQSLTQSTTTGAAPGTDIANTILASPTPQVTQTPRLGPTLVPTEHLLGIAFIDEGITQLEITADFRALPSGQYIIYEQIIDRTSDSPGFNLMHSSPLGQYRGEVLTSAAQSMLYIRDPGFPTYTYHLSAYEMIGTMPAFIMTWETRSETIPIRVLNLSTGELHAWRLSSQAGSVCKTLWTVRPDGKMLFICERGTVDLVLVFDTRTGQYRSIVVEDHPCQYREWNGAYWLLNGDIWIYCEDDRSTTSGCLLAYLDNIIICREQVNIIMAESPNGSLLVFQDDNLQPEDRNYHIAESQCIVNASKCEAVLEIEPLIRGSIAFEWDHGGTNLGYSTTTRTGNDEHFYTLVALVNIHDETQRVIVQGLRGFMFVGEFSPDDGWLMLMGEGNTTWLSVHSGQLYQVDDALYRGWYVVP